MPTPPGKARANTSPKHTKLLIRIEQVDQVASPAKKWDIVPMRTE
jgi:hypothetical protein